MAHPGVLAGLLLVVLAVPLLAFGRGGSGGDTNVRHIASVRPATNGVPAAELADPSTAASTTAAPTTVAPTTAAPTTAAPTTAAPATTARRQAVVAAPRTVQPVNTVAPSAAPAPRPAPPAPPAPKPVAPPARSQSGQGTWYRYQAGGCANNNLPKGTVVHVTNVATGATATCVVNDRGAFGYPTILDMDASVFQQIAPLSAGRINIRISW